LSGQALYAFEHQHTLWHEILHKNVYFLSADKSKGRVNYTNIKKNSGDLEAYLRLLSSIKEKEFLQWSDNQQKAFLINAYNAFTIQLVISRYPDIKSIKDIGSWFNSPWKKKFFVLLDKKISLDELEHSILRKAGRYDDPFIHVALVCAAKGCPTLRNEAYTAEKLEQQLANAVQTFLSDKQRNRYNTSSSSLEVSKIFKWYEDDFNKGYRGFFSLHDLFSRYAKQLSGNSSQQAIILAKDYDIIFLDYDWNLNDYQPES